MDGFFWYSLLAPPNVTAHPSTAIVPTSYYSMWHFALWRIKMFVVIANMRENGYNRHHETFKLGGYVAAPCNTARDDVRFA